MAGSGTNQTIGQSVNQQTLPAWENAGYQNIASQAFGQAFNPTTGLPNGSPANQTVADQTGNFSNYLNQANNAPTAGAGAGMQNNLAGYNPNISITPTSTGTWNNAAAQQYMNPYTENVLQTQEKLAHDTYGQQKAALDQQAGASGALGGDRNAVMQTGLDNDFALQEQNLQANALNSAYQNAQSAWSNDQNRQLQSDVTNSQLGLAAGIQNAELSYGAKAASNQYQLGQAGVNLQGLSQAGQAAQLAQGYAQSKNDTDYQNSMMNYLFPEQQISYAQGILNGTPKQWTDQQDTYLPQGNPFSQALGAQKAGNSGKGGGGGGTPSKSSGGSSGSGSKPSGQTPITNEQLGFQWDPSQWSPIGGVGGFQNPGYTSPNEGAEPSVPAPPDWQPGGSGLVGDGAEGQAATSPYDPMPWDATDPSSALNQYVNSFGNNAGQQFPMDLSSYYANPFLNGYGSSAIYGDTSTQPGSYMDPSVAFSATGYPYNGSYGDPDIYGLYQSDYQKWNGLQEN